MFKGFWVISRLGDWIIGLLELGYANIFILLIVNISSPNHLIT